MKYKNKAHKLILQATHILIWWNLWKNRCVSKYGCKISNGRRVRYAIYNDNYKPITSFFPQVNWPSTRNEVIHLAKRCEHLIKVQLIIWTTPPDQWIKIYTDRSGLKNPNGIG